MKKILGIILLLIIITVAVIFYASNSFVVTTNYQIKSTKIPPTFNGFKIVQLSDLHSKDFKGKIEKIIAKEKPDIVVLTGDMVNSSDSTSEFETFFSVAKNIAAEYETYYVEGNHETSFKGEKYEYFMDELTACGVTTLDNTYTQIVKDDGSYINLYGLWFNLRYYNDMSDKNREKYYLDLDYANKLLGENNPDAFNLLLTHNPVYFDTYVSWGADLTLTGHMHGGMLRIPFVGGVVSPERVTFPEYDAGEFEKENSAGESSYMIVNRGLGNGGSGFRFWNCPDISVITLSN